MCFLDADPEMIKNKIPMEFVSRFIRTFFVCIVKVDDLITLPDLLMTSLLPVEAISTSSIRICLSGS